MALHQFLLKIQALFRRRNMGREIAEELEFHQALLRERLSRQGIPPAELDVAAKRAFGIARAGMSASPNCGSFGRLKIFCAT